MTSFPPPWPAGPWISQQVELLLLLTDDATYCAWCVSWNRFCELVNIHHPCYQKWQAWNQNCPEYDLLCDPDRAKKVYEMMRLKFKYTFIMGSWWPVMVWSKGRPVEVRAHFYGRLACPWLTGYDEAGSSRAFHWYHQMQNASIFLIGVTFSLYSTYSNLPKASRPSEPDGGDK